MFNIVDAVYPITKRFHDPSVNDTMPTGPDAPPEHVILDENIKAQQHEYYSIGTFKVSPNNKLVAYAEDTKGDEIYTVYVMNIETQAPIGEPLVSVTSNLEWAGGDALVYVTMDNILRPDKVLGGFDATKYVTERQWAHASDGTLILMSLVYRKDLVKLDGSDPLLLYGYGS